ncbi:hypothetical protein SAMN05216570_1548 [Dyella sp. OK004]|uniref:hypothetical protein n=1 Tax=Dyella sp. OK004 TaxID=1855292 RepID=UPI0008EAADEE|nr:hypothetical protein [Dyella sp. OK004]SFS01668.1 hypothetical protein SAMN05216570_1548 [Dyella sp. OK004]
MMDLTTYPWAWPVLAFAAGFLLARMIYRRTDTHAAPRRDISDSEIDAALRSRQTIEAIKLYRQRTGCDLKEAKTAIQARAARLDITP